MKRVFAEDVGLASAVAAGSSAAKAELVRRYEASLRSQLERGFRVAPDVAEDLTHAVLLEALGTIDRYRGEASLRTWLSRIARSHAIGHFRRERRRARVGWCDDRELSSGVVREYAVREECAELLATLSEGERELLLLRYMAGWSLRELAVWAGRDIKVVRKRLDRVMVKLRGAAGSGAH